MIGLWQGARIQELKLQSTLQFVKASWCLVQGQHVVSDLQHGTGVHEWRKQISMNLTVCQY